ncbi:hypothetical protein BO78DRAFT_300933 [Aspergillus sclerotiicarbonarius CBS 121057]|uniref:Zn(2)-C6 fungal-type domain-containing protein n=1 Tax=Aspergillus sclerotiicarbonarius (strain CBS 121057 / IBT 28362) TaxID=1448318 RepID=A0A319F3M5_ASPSB|nr:hypothetical protein BO78DRAFT_300933 [Aspergillus sclerotiicarbonarius CBS 121057]
MVDSFIFITDVGQGGPQDRRQRPKFKRRRGACESCRQRKVRCNGDQPCDQCQRCSLACHYRSPARQRRLSVASSDPAMAEGDFPSRADDDGRNHLQPAPMSPPVSAGNMRSMPSPVPPPTLELRNGPSKMPLDASSYPFPTATNIEDEWDWEGFLLNGGLDTEDVGAQFTTSSTNSLGDTPFDLAEHTVGDEDLDPQMFATNAWDDNMHLGSVAGAGVNPDQVTRSYSFTGNLHLLISEGNIDMSRSQRMQLMRMLDRLVAGRFRLFGIDDQENTFSQKSAAETEFYNCQFAYACIDACYVDPQGIAMFLDRESLESSIGRVIERANRSPADTPLFNVLLAIGSHCLNLKESSAIADSNDYPVAYFFDRALKARHQLPAEASLSKLQAYFASKTGSNLTSALVAEATCCAQALHLNNTTAIRRSHPGPMEEGTAKRAFWFLYCLEKPHCLREGTFPFVDEAFVDHTPPRSLDSFGDPDWLLINSRYAELCSRILKRLYGRGSCCRKRERSDMVDPTEGLENALQQWEKELPFRCDTPHCRTVNYSAMTCEERRLRLSNLYRYHGAVIAIHSMQMCQNSNQWNEEMCCDSARIILSTCSSVSLADVQSDWSLYYFPSIAICDLSYIGIASGFFGRLSLDADVPFHEITELIRFAQQHLKSNNRQKD